MTRRVFVKHYAEPSSRSEAMRAVLAEASWVGVTSGVLWDVVWGVTECKPILVAQMKPGGALDA